MKFILTTDGLILPLSDNTIIVPTQIDDSEDILVTHLMYVHGEKFEARLHTPLEKTKAHNLIMGIFEALKESDLVDINELLREQVTPLLPKPPRT